MTVNKRKKNVRQRGSKTHGWGAMKKHRGAGNRGGRGMAGTGKRADQMNQWVIKRFGTGYFGKRGFVVKNKKKIKAISIKYIEDHLSDLLSKKLAKEEKGIVIINLRDLKSDKLLSNGNPTRKYKILTNYFSKKAKEKIEKTGGEIVKNI